MSAIGKNNLRLGERLPQIYGGRNIETFPNYKPSRVLRPSVPPISGYDAWYDPSDLSTLTHLAGRVSAITDKGSGANNLSATGSPGLGISPTFFNGLPAIYFSNTSGQQFASSRTMSDGTSSGFIVGCLNSFATARAFVAPNNDGGIEFSVNNSGLLVLNKSDNAGIATMSTPAVTLGTAFVAGYTLDTSSCTLWHNLSSETDAHAQTLTGSRTLVVGRIPLNATTTGEWHGYMGEIILYPTVLSSDDAQIVIQYLMSKWGIS